LSVAFIHPKWRWVAVTLDTVMFVGAVGGLVSAVPLAALTNVLAHATSVVAIASSRRRRR
jgi:hypothetical protein